MKKLLSISATALLTIFSCQNDSEIENNSVTEQSLSNPKTSSNANALVAPAKLLAADEFDTFSTTNWTKLVKTMPIPSGMSPSITTWKNVASHAYVEHSELVLVTEKVNANTVYTGRVDSNGKTFDRKYGYVEVQMEISSPADDGMQASFWFYTDNDTDNNSGQDGAEIDVFESTNKLDRYPITMHIDSYTRKRTSIKTFTGSTGGYHIYGMEWTSDKIKIYYDGTLMRTFYNGELDTDGKAINWIPTVNEYAILSVAPCWGNASDVFAKLPVGAKSRTYVNYIRWYDKKP